MRVRTRGAFRLVSVVNAGVEVYYPGYLAPQFADESTSVRPQPLVAPRR